jgi:hypothetical protein
MPVRRGRYKFIARGERLKKRIATGAATSGFIDSEDLVGVLERARMKSKAAMAMHMADARLVWDDIIVSTATLAPPPPRNTYGVDTKASRDIVKFRVWWDNFRGSTAAANARFNREDRYPAFQEWFENVLPVLVEEVFR